MVDEDGEVGGWYPYPLSRLVVNVVAAGLAVFLMFVVVGELVPLLLFLVASCVLAVFRFFVKVMYVLRMIRMSGLERGDVRKSLVERSRWVMLVGLVVIVVSVPLLLFVTQVLPVCVWLTVTACVASGFGFSEVLFFVYCKRRRLEIVKSEEAS
jgi:hypothetical protein